MTYKWVDTIRYKEVLIFDKLMKIDAKIKYVAVDADGTVMGYINLPEVCTYNTCDRFWFDPEGDTMVYLGKMDMTDLDWTTMIVEV